MLKESVNVSSVKCSYSLSVGLLVKAEKVRYMTYTLMTPGCSRPDVGCTARTQRFKKIIKQ